MLLADQVVVVTGAARGIGRALAERFAEEGARAVIIADLDADGATTVANQIGGVAVPTNVTKESDIIRLVQHTERMFGRIDLFCSNAGIIVQGGAEVPDHDWQRTWEVNVRAHIYAARAVLPGMIARGGGYLLQTASAAGLLTQIGSAPYSVTKHAAVAFAEWLAIAHYDQGIRVSVLCPQGVRTNMLASAPLTGIAALLRKTALEPKQVAEAVVKALAEERFLILPHPEVANYFERKATDYERWLRGMRRLQATSSSL
jgi:NAD(P)-dependent dehydrogenase (short-subunit alcohol dehydrogenase family)